MLQPSHAAQPQPGQCSALLTVCETETNFSICNFMVDLQIINNENIEVSQTPEQTVKLINYHAPVQHQHFFSNYVSKQIPSSDRRIEFDLQHSTIKCLKDLLISQLVTSYSLQL